MTSLSPAEHAQILSAAQTTLAGLNKEHGRNVVMKVVTLRDLHDFGLNPRYAGFVVQEEPDIIYIVPENIQVPEEAVKTVRHEFRHVLDLTGACPFCTAPMREYRALQFEGVGVAARTPSEAFRINQAIDALGGVDPQTTFPSDITIPEECREFLTFITQSVNLIVENAKLLGRFDFLMREAEKRGPEAVRALREVGTSTKLSIENERDAILREATRIAECLNRLEVRRQEERLRELVRGEGRIAGRVSPRVVAINDAINDLAVEGTVPADDERYKLKLLEAAAELKAAETHVAILHPDVAARIRELKKRLQLAIWGDVA